MATTPSTGNVPTGDAATAKIAAQSATGTATEGAVDPKAAPEQPQGVDIESREDGDVWTEAVTPPQEEVVITNTEAAQEESRLRAEDPNVVVYRKSDAPI